MNKRFSKWLEKDSFYIILFICVCVVATTAVWVSKNNLNKINDIKKGDMAQQQEKDSTENVSIVDTKDKDEHYTEERILEISKLENEQPKEKVKEKEEQKDEEQKNIQKKEQQITPQNNESTIMAIPVSGELLLDFTKDNLVYSKTLEEWTSHKGIDILSKEGTVVKASLDGVVKEVYNDDLWGIVIVINHGNNIATKYCNLSTSDMVRAGQKVKKGDAIGAIGRSASVEMLEEPHLHFEVIHNGKQVDPKQFLPNI